MKLISRCLVFIWLFSISNVFASNTGVDSWDFLNGNQEGIYSADFDEGLFERSVEKVSISSSYNDTSNVPNILINKNILYTLDSKNKVIVFDLDTKKIVKKISIPEIRTIKVVGLALHNDYLYISSEDGFVMAYSLLTENILWNISLITGINSAPLLDSNKIFIVSNSIIYALDAFSGSILWSVQGSQSGVSFKKLYIPVIYRGYLMVGLSSSDFFVISKDNGDVVWKKNLMGLAITGGGSVNPTLGDIKSSPLAFEDKVIITANNRIALFSLLEKNTIWQNVNVGSYSNTIKYGKLAILIDLYNNLVAFDIEDGKEKWKLPLLNGVKVKEKIYWNNPLIINGNLLVSNSMGGVIIFSLKENKIIKEFKLFDSSSEKLYYSPAISSKGLVFLSSKGNLYIIQQ